MDEPSAQANVASTAGQLRCCLLVAVCTTFTHRMRFATELAQADMPLRPCDCAGTAQRLARIYASARAVHACLDVGTSGGLILQSLGQLKRA